MYNINSYENGGGIMKVRIGVSNRHVHLKESDFIKLFGNVDLIKDKELYQPSQFASIYKVTIKTEKNEINNVRVMGPFREYTQVEISKSDAYLLGLNPPVRESGDLENSDVVTLVGPSGEIITNGCIIADRHIHISPLDMEKYHLTDPLCVRIGNEKKAILYDVHLKISDDAKMELHIDTDDANGNFVRTGDYGEIK